MNQSTGRGRASDCYESKGHAHDSSLVILACSAKYSYPTSIIRFRTIISRPIILMSTPYYRSKSAGVR